MGVCKRGWGIGSSKEGWIQFVHTLEQLPSGRTKLCQNLLQRPRIVVCFVGFAIVQVGGSELMVARHVVLHAREPQRFEVNQVTGVFLRRPFLLRFPGEDR